MRVIGGEFRSRRLQTPAGERTRPTSDRLRETLFNVLGPRLAEARFLDLYAGSGAVGVEALSRGAAFAGFVERAPPALAAIRSNLATLGLGARALVESRSVAVALRRLLEARESFDFVFLDPPYQAAAEYAETMGTLGRESARLLRPGAAVIAEHARREALPERFGALRRYRLLEQGDAALSFYVAEMDGAGDGLSGWRTGVPTARNFSPRRTKYRGLSTSQTIRLFAAVEMTLGAKEPLIIGVGGESATSAAKAALQMKHLQHG